ncbi:sensor histidine kinase [Rhizobium sp. EC-SD404]|uniref:sensor histidine kinase n=1 Tax=Rhizobium sp. EC-SD404 TaxID=2038389 RepID=UPI0012596777|nr:sensor histidine kinase [Rhizobium sp. EC-SD404]VVS96489.1 Signal transduction histidine kinase [Rhizobium sp. EC-SD404]
MNGSDDRYENSTLDHVLILAPYRKDADYLGRLLTGHEISARIGAQDDDLGEMLAASPGVLVTTHEALTASVIAAVADHVHAQPSWSEIPVVVLLDRASRPDEVRAALTRAWPRARLLFYQRPVTTVELVSGVQSALLARLRQRDVRDHIAQESELRRELNHRVKNILASVTSIFEMTRRGATSIEALAEDFRGRLGALDKVHSAVFHSDGENVSIAEIAKLTFDPYVHDGDARIAASGPAVLLNREAGTTLALCLHELATNAIKYGALSRPEGQVRFEWTLSHDDKPVLAISWLERGGPRVEEPNRAGYGTRYIRSALASIFGQKPSIAFEPGGLRCEARGAYSRVAATSDAQPG